MRLPPAVVFVAVSAAVLCLWVVYFIFIRGFFGPLEHAGVFGDMFGGFTALVSALGFAGIVTTLYLQMRQMEEAEQAHRDSERRNEEQLKLNAKQVEVLSAQLAAMHEQHTRERQQVEAAFEPDFHFEYKGRPADTELQHLSNKGAKVLDVRVVEGAQRFRIENPSALERNDFARLFASPYVGDDETVFFQLAYYRLNDRRLAVQRFAWRGYKIRRIVE